MGATCDRVERNIYVNGDKMFWNNLKRKQYLRKLNNS